MADYRKQLDGLTGIERMFVAIVKQTIRRKEYEFFANGKCERLADRLGIDIDIAGLIKKRVAKVR